MRRLAYLGLALALAVVLHLNWHLSLPEGHESRLDWFSGWILVAVGSVVLGALIGRVWPRRPMRTALGVALLAIVINQVLVPVISIAVGERRLGFPTDPVWWDGFPVAVAVGLPALFLAAWLLRPRARATGAPAAA